MNRLSAWMRLAIIASVIMVLGIIMAWEWGKIISHAVLSTIAHGTSVAGLVALGLGKQVRTGQSKQSTSIGPGWLVARARLFFSRFLRTYYAQLKLRHRWLTVAGRGAENRFTPELEQVFVERQFAPQNPSEFTTDAIRDKVKPGHHNIWRLLNSKTSGCLVVVGPPGSGKTTLLQHLAVTFSRNRQLEQARDCRAFVPILLFLRDHIKAITEEPTPTLAELVTACEKQEKTDPPDNWFEGRLRAGQCLVMFDGLDEVTDAEQRQKVAAWLDRQVNTYGNNRFIVTARPVGYESNPLRQARVLEVQPFNFRQVETFVRRWYAASEDTGKSSDAAGARMNAEIMAGDLMSRLKIEPTLGALATSPWHLTLITMLHSHRGALPERRVELYGEICDVLLGHWQPANGFASDLTGSQIRAVLQPLALQMMRNRQREISTGDALEIMREPLARVGCGQPDNPQNFLKDLHERSGLLGEREAGVTSFVHRTFQEYLAAAKLVEDQDEAAVVSCVPDAWWHETIRLYAAQGDATGIVRACLGSGTAGVTAMTLAYECASEGLLVDPNVLWPLEGRLVDDLESANEENRRLAAEVLLSLRLRHFIWIDEHTKLDISYISCAEYQLFIDEQQPADSRCRQPDHWPGTRFARGTALQPVAGIRADDAAEFCKWLTARHQSRGGWSSRFRLPTAIETESNPVQPQSADALFRVLQGTSIGTWCGGGFAVAGVPEEFLISTGAGLRKKILANLITDFSSIFMAFWVRAHARGPRPEHRAHTLGRILDNAHALAGGLARDLGLDSALDLDGAFELALDLDLDPDRKLELDHELALDLPGARARGLDLDQAIDYTRAIAAARALELARALQLDFDLAGGLDLARALERNGAGETHHAREIHRELNRVLNRIGTRNRDANRDRNFCLAAAWILQSAVLQKGRSNLIRGWRRFWQSNSQRKWTAEVTAIRDQCLAAYVALAWFEERRRGNFPAWEGIRLVREEAPDPSSSADK